MDGFTSIIVAVITTIGTVAAAAFGARKIAARSQPDRLGKQLGQARETAEFQEARADLLAERNADLTTKNGELERKLAARDRALEGTRQRLDDCVRQRDNAYDELRGVTHRTKPRNLDAADG